MDIQQEVLYKEKEQQFSIIAVCLVFLTQTWCNFGNQIPNAIANPCNLSNVYYVRIMNMFGEI